MARLTTMPSRLAVPKPRLGTVVGDTKAQERERAQLKPWRAWYNLKRWQKLRRLVFARAGYVCQQTGVALVGKEPAPNAPVCDHILEHKGDPALFWDADNLQAVSKAWHDSEKQKQERARHA
ncbi:hypothetical protein P775_28770 [Puniceibacterium antarcticum]|uniref:HNH nuclease domain-containing protein n=1 Tax=Puniceibacterium antarcticum TaxID=1206336 RepID=A0A2G8QQZ3_9RHOB|nr:endonuclease [Puniceibacterium antarcticum]PIL11694.1 hypothetical protein P775_28770 [Puniceibacterium antarcticum]